VIICLNNTCTHDVSGEPETDERDYTAHGAQLLNPDDYLLASCQSVDPHQCFLDRIDRLPSDHAENLDSPRNVPGFEAHLHPQIYFIFTLVTRI
jgi:hypothetical protein